MTREPDHKARKSPPRADVSNAPVSKRTSVGDDSLQETADERTNESELPEGQPLEQLTQKLGKHYIGDEDTPFTGIAEESHNGKRIRLISFANGLRDGAEYTFDTNGFVLQEVNYSEDYLDGTHTFWWPNGAKKEERVWVKGNLHPRESRRWDRDGRLIEEKIDDSF